MKIIKYQHACFTIEIDGKLLVVDPGAFTNDLPALENVVGIVVTHAHADHFDVTALGALISHSPHAVVYAHADIVMQLGDTLPSHAVAAGEVVHVGPFSLEFTGGEHAVIHQSIPNIANLGVLINETVYYPGDSFTVPKKPISILALPLAAPWLKLSESIDFLSHIKPRVAFPTHDAILSDAGKTVADSMILPFAQKLDTTYQRLDEPLTLNE